MRLALFAFALAACVALFGTPILRRVALSTGFMDRPGAHKSHHVPVAYLGGVSLVLATLAGALTSATSAELGLVGFLASLLAIVGLLDDDHQVAPLLRLALQLGCATVAAASGIRIEISGIHAMDFALTILWIVAMTNAINFLDNMDGLAAGVCAAVGIVAAALAISGGQRPLSAMAAALAGACTAFLAFNARPAAIYMGDTGSLFIGFITSILVLEVTPDLRPPSSFAVPLLLLALPCFDIATVILGRLRHGIPVMVGGRNHLSHRLVARGFSRGWAVATLVATEAICAASAFMAARGLIATKSAMFVGASALLVLFAITFRAPVWGVPRQKVPRRLKQLVLTASALVAILTVAPVAQMLRAQHLVGRGTEAAEAGLLALQTGDLDSAEARFRTAANELGTARAMLDSPLVSAGLAVPILNSNIYATREVVGVAHDLAIAAGQSIPLLRNSISIQSNRIDLDGVVAAQPTLAQSATVLQRAANRLNAVHEPFMLDAVDDRLHRLAEAVGVARALVERADALTQHLPALFGSVEPRTYALAVQDRTDPDATGGAIISWTPVQVDKGAIHVGSPRPVGFRSTSFDFATGTADFAASLERSGDRVDAVILADSEALLSILRLVGRPVTAADRQMLAAQPETAEDRSGLVASLRTAAAQLSTALGTDTHIHAQRAFLEASSLSGAGHVRLWSTRQSEMAVFGLVGGTPAPASGTSVRTLRGEGSAAPALAGLAYRFELTPKGDQAEVRGQIVGEVTSPPGGPFELLVRSPFTFESAQLNDQPVTLGPGDARDQLSRSLSVPAGSDTRAAMTLRGNAAINDEWLTLDVDGSTVPTRVTIAAAPGWKIIEAEGAQLSGTTVTALAGPNRSTQIRVRMAPTGLRGYIWLISHRGTA